MSTRLTCVQNFLPLRVLTSFHSVVTRRLERLLGHACLQGFPVSRVPATITTWNSASNQWFRSAIGYSDHGTNRSPRFPLALDKAAACSRWRKLRRQQAARLSTGLYIYTAHHSVLHPSNSGVSASIDPSKATQPSPLFYLLLPYTALRPPLYSHHRSENGKTEHLRSGVGVAGEHAQRASPPRERR